MVPATAEYTDDNNTTHVGMLGFGDCDISEDNAKTSAPHETANLTCENQDPTVVRRPCSDFTDMLRRHINCRIIIIIIKVARLR